MNAILHPDTDELIATKSAMRARAESFGYNGGCAVARLVYGTFVSTRHRYMYAETPKAACTSWKQMILGVEGARFDETQVPYHRETRRDMLVHQRRYVDIPSLIDVSTEVREEILTGASGWLTFAICRNPFGRLVSVFENKIRLGEPGYRALEARYGGSEFASPADAFRAFVRDIVTGPATLLSDAHLRPQVDLLLPRLVPYRLFRLEDISEAVVAFSRHLRSNGHVGEIALTRRNESLGRSWRDYFDAQTAEIVADTYAEDFKTFGYDIADWRGGAPIVETEEERRWRAEVVARNAMLDWLYDRLGTPARSEVG